MEAGFFQVTVHILVFIIAIEHFAFLILEMFLWTKKSGRKIFANTKEEAEASRVLAANQGLYNGFLSIGLLWGLLHPNPDFSQQLILFFLLCVLIAGIYGGLSAKRSILFIQALPALITLILMQVLA